MVFLWYEISERTFHLIGTNGFRGIEWNFSVVGLVVVRTSNLNISRRRLADYVKKLHQKACTKNCTKKRAARASHVQHDYFSLFNHSNHSFVALPVPSTWFLKLPSYLNYMQPHVTNLQWETISSSPFSALDTAHLTSLSLFCLIFISTRHRAWESGAVFVASWRSLPSVRYSSCFSLMFAWAVWIVVWKPCSSQAKNFTLRKKVEERAFLTSKYSFS